MILAARIQGRIVLVAAALACGACATRQFDYPQFATVAAPRVLAEVNGVKVFGGGFGSALAVDPRERGYKSEGLAVISDTMIAVSNDDDFGIVPDGKGGISAKRLPGAGNMIDTNRVYFIRLDKPLR